MGRNDSKFTISIMSMQWKLSFPIKSYIKLSLIDSLTIFNKGKSF